MSKRLGISFLLFGIAMRFLIALLMNHDGDTFNILALVKSLIDTGSLLPGFFRTGNVQLYGLLFYQISAAWVLLLNHFHFLDIRYIFDVAPYTPGRLNYMYPFPILTPELYQMTVIKLLQFIWDIPLLVGTLFLAKELKVPQRHWIIAAWAFNPVAIYTGYVLYQSDFFMMALLIWGIYFAVKSLNTTTIKHRILFSALCFILLAGGAVIKQVPGLFIPFFLILLSRSVKEFLLNCAMCALGYITFYQPWNKDLALMKTYFLTSQESTNIFLYNINNYNLFLSLFAFLFIFFLVHRKKFITYPVYTLYLTLLIFTLLFIAQDPQDFFVQFMLWPMPFLAMLALLEREFTIFYLLPLVGFLRRCLEDEFVLTGSLALPFGEPLSHPMSWVDLLAKYFDEKLIDTAMVTFFVLGFSLLAYLLITKILTKPMKRVYETLRLVTLTFPKGIFLFFLATYIICIGMIAVSEQQLPLTSYNYYTSSYGPSSFLLLTEKNPFTLTVTNSNKQKITGIKLMLKRGDLHYEENLVITVTDRDTGKPIATGAIPDDFLPTTADYKYITFDRPVSAKDMTLSFSQPNYINSVYIVKAEGIGPLPASQMPRTDVFYSHDPVKITNNTQYAIADLFGNYTARDMLFSFVAQLHKKPKFFILYFTFILCLTAAGVAGLCTPFFPSRKKVLILRNEVSSKKVRRKINKKNR